MKTLFELTQDIVRLQETLDAMEDGLDVNEQQIESVEQWLTDLNEQHADKIDGYAAIIRQLEHEAETAKQIEQEYACKCKQRTKRAEMLRDRLKWHMEQIGVKRLQTDRVTVAIQGNGGALPIVILNEDVIPFEYYVAPEPVISKTMIAKALAAGCEVPGAKLGERGTRLVIK